MDDYLSFIPAQYRVPNMIANVSTPLGRSESALRDLRWVLADNDLDPAHRVVLHNAFNKVLLVREHLLEGE